ncbi:hypothetical protein BASA60_008684 [Batrachochytrium salamandrivorans]|nr:hypothetical protein BASA60_008684 [Batrachochytrium salamandrivorans]
MDGRVCSSSLCDLCSLSVKLASKSCLLRISPFDACPDANLALLSPVLANPDAVTSERLRAARRSAAIVVALRSWTFLDWTADTSLDSADRARALTSVRDVGNKQL